MGNNQEALNFGAGPAKLPREVLLAVQAEMLSYSNSGMSIMEISHRSKEFSKINDDAQSAVRSLLKLPSNYKVLFLQGGGTGLFAAIAMNLITRTGTADYAITGTWSAKAAKEAEKYGKINLVFPKLHQSEDIPSEKNWKKDANASYLYYCDNETVDGVEFAFIPTPPDGVPLVADMSSSIMTKNIPVNKFGLIFAGAQKNIGPAGVTLVIVQESLLGHTMSTCPSVFDFNHVANLNSIHNTPATFSVYVMEKVLQWIIKSGGVDKMEKLNKQKSDLLYTAIESSNNFYYCPINVNARSRINVPFKVGGPKGNEILESQFIEEAEKAHLKQLKGHRLIGGIRASLYNAVSLDDVKRLVEFMFEFKKKYG